MFPTVTGQKHPDSLIEGNFVLGSNPLWGHCTTLHGNITIYGVGIMALYTYGFRERQAGFQPNGLGLAEFRSTSFLYPLGQKQLCLLPMV